jgi:pimeloyl-ACP methyl ester carboxylesterase
MATVISRDGTRIEYDLQGDGPAVVLVDGALTHRGFGSMPRLAGLLAKAFTVVSYDRRGRGESGDTPPYALEREVEDIAALIAETGNSASVYGISSGACLALEAALRLGAKVERLAMYEPPYDSEDGAAQAWREYAVRLASFIHEGRNGDAVDLFLRLVGTPADVIEGVRRSPVWKTLEAVAPTLVYDQAAVGEYRKVPTERAAGLNIPVLVMNGTLSRPFMAHTAAALAAAIPNGRHVTLEGQRHDVDPEILAPILLEFLKQ